MKSPYKFCHLIKGKNCQHKVERECLKNNCQHNSTCVPNRLKNPDITEGYTCECLHNYEGMYCEKKVDLCRGVRCEPYG